MAAYVVGGRAAWAQRSAGDHDGGNVIAERVLLSSKRRRLTLPETFPEQESRGDSKGDAAAAMKRQQGKRRERERDEEQRGG